MNQCPNCNQELEAEAKFCENCGTSIEEKLFCANCGQPISAEDVFCPGCGASAGSAAEEAATPEEKKSLLSKIPFKISKKMISIGAACIAVILIIAIVLPMLLGGGQTNYALYVKDGEMYYTGISKIKPFQVTSDLFDKGFDKSDIANSGSNLGGYTTVSSDGKTIFYFDKMDYSSGGTLYYRSVNKPKREAEKIDKDITVYSVSESGKIVTYLDNDGNLYQHNLKDKEKIAGDVEEYYVSADGKKLCFTDDEDDLYIKNGGKDKEKIDSEISYIKYVTKDINDIYYIKEDTLYKKNQGKDKVKIVSDVDSVLRIYETGEMYYTKMEEEEVALADYVDDDMKDADAAMVEPEYPDYPSYFDYDTTAEYEAAYDAYEKARDTYWDEYEKYYEKESRDTLRESLEGRTVEKTSYTLYYYDGKKETVLTENMAYDDYSGYDAASDSPVLTYRSMAPGEVAKVKLSEINGIYDLENKISDAEPDSSILYVANKGSVSEIEQTEARNLCLSDDGKVLYFVDDVDNEKSEGELYKLNISGGKTLKPEKYDSDVYVYSIRILDDGRVLYYKDTKDDEGELYINKEKIDDDVYRYNVSVLDNGDVIYLADWNENKDKGTLKICKGKKAKVISEDVNDYSITPNDEVLFLYDYSTKSYKGELMLYKGGKPKKVDEDVTTIVPVYKIENEGGVSYGS